MDGWRRTPPAPEGRVWGGGRERSSPPDDGGPAIRLSRFFSFFSLLYSLTTNNTQPQPTMRFAYWSLAAGLLVGTSLAGPVSSYEAPLWEPPAPPTDSPIGPMQA